MIKFILINLLFITISNATEISSVSSGNTIEASKINELIQKINQLEQNQNNQKILPVGSVVHSLLSLSQFQSQNEDCWRLMDGSSLLLTDELRSNFGYTNIPNANGRFLRNAGAGAATLGQTQEDDFESHTHVQNSHNHIGGYPRAGSTATYPYSDGLYGEYSSGTGTVSAQASGSYNRLYAYTSGTTAVNQNTGGTETRPKNLTVNMFVKVNVITKPSFILGLAY